MALLADDERLWRRVSPGQRLHDGAAMSSAFKCENMCVHVVRKTTLEKVRQDYPNDHVYEFTVRDARAGGAACADDELQPGDPEDHAIVLPGEATAKQRFGKHIKRVARRVWPDGPPP